MDRYRHADPEQARQVDPDIHLPDAEPPKLGGDKGRGVGLQRAPGAPLCLLQKRLRERLGWRSRHVGLPPCGTRRWRLGHRGLEHAWRLLQGPGGSIRPSWDRGQGLGPRRLLHHRHRLLQSHSRALWRRREQADHMHRAVGQGKGPNPCLEDQDDLHLAEQGRQALRSRALVLGPAGALSVAACRSCSTPGNRGLGRSERPAACLGIRGRHRQPLLLLEAGGPAQYPAEDTALLDRPSRGSGGGVAQGGHRSAPRRDGQGGRAGRRVCHLHHRAAHVLAPEGQTARKAAGESGSAPLPMVEALLSLESLVLPWLSVSARRLLILLLRWRRPCSRVPGPS